MLNVQSLIIKTMKKEIFIGELRNKAARQVLSELKTSFVDVREEITAEIQNKILNKMKASREKTIPIYEKANAVDNLNKEKAELEVINELLKMLEEFLPKQMSDKEILKIVNQFKSEGKSIKDVMIFFKDKNADKKKVSMFFNQK